MTDTAPNTTPDTMQRRSPRHSGSPVATEVVVEIPSVPDSIKRQYRDASLASSTSPEPKSTSEHPSSPDNSSEGIATHTESESHTDSDSEASPESAASEHATPRKARARKNTKAKRKGKRTIVPVMATTDDDAVNAKIPVGTVTERIQHSASEAEHGDDEREVGDFDVSSESQKAVDVETDKGKHARTAAESLPRPKKRLRPSLSPPVSEAEEEANHEDKTGDDADGDEAMPVAEVEPKEPETARKSFLKRNTSFDVRNACVVM